VRAAPIAAAVVAVLGLTVHGGRAASPRCADVRAAPAYTAAVDDAVAAGRDVWGERLLASRGGPTYAAAERYLSPLALAVGWHREPLTASGFYYVPFSFPFTPYGSTMYALHVADGSQIITRHVTGPSLTIDVGDGSERYGSCLGRLTPAQLADGYEPILRTAYVDGNGVEYRQESFVGRLHGSDVVSFVRLDVDASRAVSASTVRFVPWPSLPTVSADRAAATTGVKLIVSEGAEPTPDGPSFEVLPGTAETLYADWFHGRANVTGLQANAATYEHARSTVSTFWSRRLADGAQFEVPEQAVDHAEAAVLTQAIGAGWRYSIGNLYEELSFAESLDSAEVLTEYGHGDVAKAIIRLALQRLQTRPERFTAWRAGHVLSTAAFYYRSTHDTLFLREATPSLAALVRGIAARRVSNGVLRPEPLSSDLQAPVDGVTAPIAAWQGLLAVSRVWGATGRHELSAHARRLALDLERALQPAVSRVLTPLRDGSLFLPQTLSTRPRAYDRLTSTSDGSYWNLVVPYALASGYFPPQSPAARGILRYLLAHGARMLGVPRANAHIVYGRGARAAGLAPAYGVSAARFFADNDQPDELALSLYGMLAVGMTRGTYVSGESVSVLPVGGMSLRRMYMPPNSGANASFLETLRLLLVHERRGDHGAPRGLDLAFATPRAWLEDGKTIAVRRAPTSFGRVSYAIARAGRTVDVRLVLPPRAHARLRLRLPAGRRIASVRAGATRVAFDRATGTIALGARRGAVRLRVTLTP
jgi:hypothetical protein